MPKQYLYIVAMSLLVAMQLSCVSQPQARKNPLLQKLQWPAAPAAAKVRYIRAFSQADELGIERSFWQQIGDFFAGEEATAMVRPTATVTLDNSIVYVADPGVHGVHRFNIKQQSYKLLVLKDNRPLPSPVAMAADSEGNVFVTDSKLARVFKITHDAEYVTEFSLDTPLRQPTGLLFHKQTGNFYIVDTAQHRVMIFNPQGQYTGAFGQRGLKPGEFNYPTMIAQNSQGQILVTDSMNFRVQVFDEAGHFIKTFGQQGDASGFMSRPKGIAVDSKNNIYVVDSLFHNVQLFDAKGQYLMALGEQGQDAGEFWLPTGIYINEQQFIYVADSHNRRIQVFKILGAVQ